MPSLLYPEPLSFTATLPAPPSRRVLRQAWTVCRLRLRGLIRSMLKASEVAVGDHYAAPWCDVLPAADR